MASQIAGIDGSFMRALAISSVLHVLLLWPSPSPPTAAGHAAARLSATLRAFDRPVEPPPAVPPREPHPSHSPVFVPAHPPVLSRTEAASSEPVVFAPPAVGASPAPAPDRAAQAQAQAAAVTRPVPAAEGLDADGLRQLRLSLAREARRFKRYPARALEAGWSGTAEVRLTFADAGPMAEVVRGSGHDVLDEAALEMLRQAIPRTSMPESLRGRIFAVSLPVVFELPD